MNDDAFLQAIRANPDDAHRRLVYADWLDEHHQPQRAEFIRLRCTLAELAPDDPRRADLEARERELLADHAREWSAAFLRYLGRYDLLDGKQPKWCDAMEDAPEYLQFLPDCRTIMASTQEMNREVGEYEGAVYFWDILSDQVRHIEDRSPYHTGLCALSPDGRTFAWAVDGEGATLNDVSTGRKRARLRGCGELYSLAYSPNGSVLATGDRDGTITFWDATSNKKLAKLKTEQCVMQIAFSPNGKLLATAHTGNTVRIWDLQALGCETLFDAKDRPARQRVRTFSESQYSTALPTGDSRCSVAFSPDGVTLATGQGSTVILWDVRDFTQRAVLTADREHSMAFHPDGKTLATSAGGEVKLWDVMSGQLLASADEVGGWCIRFSRDGRYLANSRGDKHGGEVGIYDVSAVFNRE